MPFLMPGRPHPLTAYVDTRDERAFGELVRRHAAVVWKVCRALLPSEQDAEDAFQAVFLILARRAASVRHAGSLASWLYGVARRTSLTLRARRRREAVGTHVEEPSYLPVDRLSAEETCRAILEEVERLPEKHRLVLLLCGLQGLSRAEAAQQLGWKEGTVAGRLARARERIRQRLAERGILSATTLAGPSLLEEVFPLSPRSLLLQAATRAALRYAEGSTPSGTSSSALALAREVTRNMILRKYVLALMMSFLALVVGAAGSGLLLRSPAAVGQSPPPNERTVENRPAPEAPKEKVIEEVVSFQQFVKKVQSPDLCLTLTVGSRYTLPLSEKPFRTQISNPEVIGLTLPGDLQQPHVEARKVGVCVLNFWIGDKGKDPQTVLSILINVAAEGGKPAGATNLEVILEQPRLITFKEPLSKMQAEDPELFDLVLIGDTPREVSLLGKKQGSGKVTFWFKDAANPEREVRWTLSVQVNPKP